MTDEESCPECGALVWYVADGERVALIDLYSRVVKPREITCTVDHQRWCTRLRPGTGSSWDASTGSNHD